MLLNVIVGYFSTSKKSAVRRSLSRFSEPVSIEAAWMVSSTFESAGVAGRIRSPLVVAEAAFHFVSQCADLKPTFV